MSMPAISWSFRAAFTAMSCMSASWVRLTAPWCTPVLARSSQSGTDQEPITDVGSTALADISRAPPPSWW
jgi:hypothetical protein